MAVLIQNLNRALFCLILTPGNKISFLGSYQKALTRCCNDPLRTPRLSGGILKDHYREHRHAGTFPRQVTHDLAFTLADSDRQIGLAESIAGPLAGAKLKD